MVFSKPSTITNAVGAYSYKRGVSSNTENYIDNNFPKALDKTGEVATSGGGVTGEIDWKSGSSIKMLAGSSLILGSEIVIQSGGDINVLSGGKIIFQTGSTIEGIITFPGSSQTFFDGYGYVSGAAGFFGVGNLGTFQLDVGATSNVFSEFDFQSGSVLKFNNGSHISGNMIWLNSANAPIISQAGTSSGAGKDFSINAQGTSASSQIGGNILLTSGNGTSTTASSAVILQPVGTGGGPIVAYPFTGSVASQRLINGTFLRTVTTTGSGSPIPFFSFTMANNSAATIRVSWIRRATTVGSYFGNEAVGVISCSSTGVLSGYANIKELIAPSSDQFDLWNTVFNGIASTNTFGINAIQSSLPAMDYQIVITINYC